MHAWRDGVDVVFDETYVHWAENRTDQTRVILFADIERPLRTRWMDALNRRVGAFMGRHTASPNEASDRTGAVNRLYAFTHRVGQSNKRLKKRHPRGFRAGKYAAIVLVLWLLFLCPWPLLR
jgi:beta-hydroxylase